jgi:hypothetical protein
MQKKTCLIPDDGEYRLKRSRVLARNYKSTGSDFSNGSRAKRATLVSMRWGCAGYFFYPQVIIA